MTTVTVDEFEKTLKAQGVPLVDVQFICPACGTRQSANDLIKAGAGADFDEVEKYLAYSCVGRWTHGKPPPALKKKGTQVGCNWTLGGLFRIHTYQVEVNGEKHPRFEPVKKEDLEVKKSSREPFIKKIEALLEPDPEGQPICPEAAELLQQAIETEKKLP